MKRRAPASAHWSSGLEELGWRVEAFPGDLGRAAVASRNFEPGELFLVESPLLEWPANPQPDSHDLALGTINAIVRKVNQDAERNPERYAPVHIDTVYVLAALAKKADDDDVLARVRDFGVPLPARDTPYLASLRRIAAETAAAPPFTGLSVQDCVHAVLATTTNSFAAGTDMCGLFERAAKIAHCCTPTLLHAWEEVEGRHRLVVRVVRHIRAGELATTSYLPGKYLAIGADLRRAQLDWTKSFECQCQRCSGPDTCRGLWCAGDGCDGSVFPGPGGGRRWGPCDRCGAAWADGDMPLAAEAEAAGNVASWMGGEAGTLELDGGTAATLAAYAEQLGRTLGPRHWTAAWCRRLAAQHVASNLPRAAGPALEAAVEAAERHLEWSAAHVEPHFAQDAAHFACYTLAVLLRALADRHPPPGPEAAARARRLAAAVAERYAPRAALAVPGGLADPVLADIAASMRALAAGG